MVCMATANGPAIATDVLDVELQGLGANARAPLLKGNPAVLSFGRLVLKQRGYSVQKNDEAVMTDNAGGRHEYVTRNNTTFL